MHSLTADFHPVALHFQGSRPEKIRAALKALYLGCYRAVLLLFAECFLGHYVFYLVKRYLNLQLFDTARQYKKTHANPKSCIFSSARHL
jgi:hypothetical protein